MDCVQGILMYIFLFQNITHILAFRNNEHIRYQKTFGRTHALRKRWLLPCIMITPFIDITRLTSLNENGEAIIQKLKTYM
jgi:hypothetical protein